MSKIFEQWFLFQYVGLEFTPLSKPFKTREQAEKAREKYPERLRKGIADKEVEVPSFGLKRCLQTETAKNQWEQPGTVTRVHAAQDEQERVCIMWEGRGICHLFSPASEYSLVSRKAARLASVIPLQNVQYHDASSL
jgi:hypothetical protein